MRLEDRIGVFWLQHVQVAGQSLEMLAQSLIRYDLIELLVLSLERVSLSAKHEGKLLLGHRVGA
jgi:hypothetical protein